ncbi:hypothetical protein H6P81_004078 [Aristolochia fimbriata]|uniref:Uncharacterized protein n=1 Tax=Aristolochia fimbriata TaxID=158543 RepID=A0AAV7FEE1_ARIFI|nr:hypothetical protein H6P81_004078 [Aristolochia fimbriata]
MAMMLNDASICQEKRAILKGTSHLTFTPIIISASESEGTSGGASSSSLTPTDAVMHVMPNNAQPLPVARKHRDVRTEKKCVEVANAFHKRNIADSQDPTVLSPILDKNGLQVILNKLEVLLNKLEVLLSKLEVLLNKLIVLLNKLAVLLNKLAVLLNKLEVLLNKAFFRLLGMHWEKDLLAFDMGSIREGANWCSGWSRSTTFTVIESSCSILINEMRRDS